MLGFSIWFSAPRIWMDGGLESSCVGRVCGADVAVRRTVTSAPHTISDLLYITSTRRLANPKNARLRQRSPA